MKVLKNSLLGLMNICTIILSLIVSAGVIWYLLPSVKDTSLGTFVLSLLSEKALFWFILISSILLVLFIVLDIIFNKEKSAKYKNFFVHINTWICCLVGVIFTVVTFALVNPLITTGITINIPKKIVIGIDLFILVMFHIFSGKLAKLINRKIQSYDNAKEINVLGRSSIVWVNILKLVDIVFPEILVLILLCVMLSWDVAGYFTILLLSCIIPIIGNIICDLNIRKEITIKDYNKHKKLVDDVADKIKEGK